MIRNLLQRKNIIGLSPMDGITDVVFRQVLSTIAPPDIYFTEFVSAEGISRGGVRLYDQLLYRSNQRPIVGQIFGKDPESFYKSAIILCHLGFDGIDLNMGCPAKTVTQHGSGAALIEKPALASNLIKSAQKGIKDYFSSKVSITDLGLKNASLAIINRNLLYSEYLPQKKSPPTFSVKTRLGINEDVSQQWIPFLLSHKLDFLTLHGRTLKQGYSGLADWEAIYQASVLAKSQHTPFLGNGDISSLSQAQQFIKDYDLNGVLIGRSSMGNPWIFSDIIPTLPQKFSAMLLHAQIFEKTFPHRRFDPLRKHFLLYTSGHPRAKQLRQKIVRLNSLKELLDLEADYLNC